MSKATLADLASGPGRDGPPDGAGIPAPPRRWIARYGIPGALVAGMLGLLGASAWGSLRPATEVEVEAVVQKASSAAAPRAGSAVVQAAGWVEADPYLRHATSLADGVVAEMLVLEGDAVRAGQVLARLVDDDAVLALRRAEFNAARARAARADAEARLAAARESWDNPVELRRAVDSAEAALAEARASAERIRSELAAARSDAEQARADAGRVASLEGSATVSEQDLVDARTRAASFEARAEALASALEEAAARIRRMDAESAAARENLRLRTADRLALDAARAALDAARAEEAHAQAALDEARLRVDRLEVRAPADGVVVERFKEPGSKVMLGADDPRSATIASLYDPARIQVRVDVALADAALVAVGQPCEVVVEVLPGAVFQGRVTRLLHIADIQKNTLQAKVAILDPRPELRPEMIARVRFLEHEPEDAAPAPAGESPAADASMALFAPATAIADGGAWVVTGFDGERGSAARRAVEAGRASSGWVEVRSGLAPGDLVVTRAASPLAEGARVRVRPVEGAF